MYVYTTSSLFIRQWNFTASHIADYLFGTWLALQYPHFKIVFGIALLLANLSRGYPAMIIYIVGFPGSSTDKESTCNAGDQGLTPRLGRSPGEGIGYALQYS